MRTKPISKPLLIAILSTAGLALAPGASAQNALGYGDALGDGRGTDMDYYGYGSALGHGNALDNNLRVGSGGFNSASNHWRAEIAYRNALVTGNVGGGRQFRGDVGYSGVNDFRSELGSDLVYNFDRETFYSGLATRQVRGIDATSLMMQGPMAGMRSGPSGLSGGLIIERPGAGVQAGGVTHSSVSPENQISDQLAFDRVNTTLRSTSAYTVRDAIRPQIVGAATDGNNQYYLAASPLGGVNTINPLHPSLVSNRSVNPEQFDLDPRIAIPGFREQAVRDQELMNQLEDAEAIANRMPSHLRILEDLRGEAIQRGLINEEMVIRPEGNTDSAPGREPAIPAGNPAEPEGTESGAGFNFPAIGEPQNPNRAGDRNTGNSPAGNQPVAPGPVDELDRLLRGFSQDLQPGQNPLGPAGTSGETPDTSAPELGPTSLRRLKDPDQAHVTDADAIATQDRMDRMIELLRDQTTTIERIAPSAGGSLYAQHMRAGERLLGEGKWFIAEERFVAALTAKPGDAMAAIGRIHAQIGAGLYLSASVNLSDLLRAYPELVPVRYDDRLIPTNERLQSIRKQLREHCLKDDAAARNAGFLLAYLGYQTERPNDVREGFAVVKRVNDAMQAPTDPLVSVLLEIWSNPQESDTQPMTPNP